MVIRRYSLVLLVGVLVILTGIGGVAHALSKGCVDLHCEHHTQPSVHSALATSGDVSASGHHHDPESSETGKCNPFICQAVALPFQVSEVAKGRRDTDPELHVGTQVKLSEPDALYRPPDL